MNRIETQKTILHQTPIVERYVEIGPSRILANMATKQALKELHADSHLVKRQFLSSSDNQKEIFYHYPDDEPIDFDHDVANNLSSPSIEAYHTDQPASAPVSSPAASTVPTAATVEDVPITATDIIIALVAQKLRKDFDKIPTTKSIQELSGGRFHISSLHNRVVTYRCL